MVWKETSEVFVELLADFLMRASYSRNIAAHGIYVDVLAVFQGARRKFTVYTSVPELQYILD